MTSNDGPNELEPGKRGISHLVAEALLLLDLDVVLRSTIAALMPKPNDRAARRSAKCSFRTALKRFESYGWIMRDDPYIRVVMRAGLRDWASRGVDVCPERAQASLDIVSAAKEINDALQAGRAVSAADNCHPPHILNTLSETMQ